MLLYGDLLNSLDITNPIIEGVNDLDVLDIWDSVLDITETLHIILEALIKLLLDCLQDFSH
jgi:hypothetical protein